MSRKAAKGQKIILEEIKKQLVTQAERWGRTDYYTPLKLEEIEIEQCRKISGELLSEKSNLEYELHFLESDKKEVLSKIDRLEIYIKKADRAIKRHEKLIEKIIGGKTGEKIQVGAKKSKISVLISDN
ncbi:hypothetical protein A2276_05615 [candidate division WOR-1 bacterium RIFOXYA12_FULL_43_27]|uniref:Uncharacterized protein n=1 Tax=candidate division WOR-1 bacterium RIFOXYC2_FULL_46_14 TaxID=1802587 RepID=A0A1F4U3Q9_UNCSA|nr:MAG: hypothetical protein A2276_05615 [candidate division WOR-1 bacterium RIFOXYA12_FULL_43_27]OGC20143.1 MAG: hypothetical protein A2292_03620 [candidate division WOR-1 bacterium RIFOXYB2_FULL_46_45]OGC32120.1 MAG: hypothetical protein A2232_07830 [candidate division WOR-1 bacterium RIFOXYA2_FULL_46_56]OGC39521.1 MAG: hypothetical protein A2438_08195 [candidate division WOR-1 bacterium RIFOXYC2_FULL_46_14]